MHILNVANQHVAECSRMQYLAEVDCPLAYRPRENEEDLLDWLLRLAVAYAFEDQGEQVGLPERVHGKYTDS